MLMQTGYQSNTDSKYDFVSDLEKQLNQVIQYSLALSSPLLLIFSSTF